MRMSSQATEYVYSTITVDGAAPSGSTVVAFAFLPGTDPTSATVWQTGEWSEGRARLLIGPANGGHVLAVGSYRVFVRVTDNLEVPVLRAGYLTVY